MSCSHLSEMRATIQPVGMRRLSKSHRASGGSVFPFGHATIGEDYEVSLTTFVAQSRRFEISVTQWHIAQMFFIHSCFILSFFILSFFILSFFITLQVGHHEENDPPREDRS